MVKRFAGKQAAVAFGAVGEVQRVLGVVAVVAVKTRVPAVEAQLGGLAGRESNQAALVARGLAVEAVVVQPDLQGLAFLAKMQALEVFGQAGEGLKPALFGLETAAVPRMFGVGLGVDGKTGCVQPGVGQGQHARQAVAAGSVFGGAALGRVPFHGDDLEGEHGAGWMGCGLRIVPQFGRQGLGYLKALLQAG